MSKLWERSGQIERDNNDARALGALAYFYVGGTTTPLTVYQDADATTPHEHPVEADGNGRWPAVFVPFCASFDVKITTAGGTLLFYPTEIPNPDPVEAAENTVDANQLLQTGDVIWSPVDETRAGFVRLNGRSIGNASSGATERANADTVDLFTFLWNKLANSQAAVSGGRGASAAADYAANKTITLLDARASLLFGLDDMGNSAASRLGSAPFTSGDAITQGSVVGENAHALATGELASHTHSFSATTGAGSAHTHTGTTASGGGHTHTTGIYGGMAKTSHSHGDTAAHVGNDYGDDTNTTTSSDGAHTHTFTSDAESAHTHSVSGTSGSQGSGTAHNVVSRGLLGTYFQKL